MSLREFLSEKIARTDERAASDRRLFGISLGGLVALGGVVWFFVERHLADLNHENARVAKVSENSVSSDTYKANEQQRKSEQDKLDDRLAKYDENFTKAISRDDLMREVKVEKRAVGTYGWAWVGGIAALAVTLIALYTFAVAQNDAVPAVPAPTVTVTVPTEP